MARTSTCRSKVSTRNIPVYTQPAVIAIVTSTLSGGDDAERVLYCAQLSKTIGFEILDRMSS